MRRGLAFLLLFLLSPVVGGDLTIQINVTAERLPTNPTPSGFTSFSCADTILDILSMETSVNHQYTPRPSFTSLMNLLGGGANIRLGHWWAPNNSSHSTFSYPEANASNLQRVSEALHSFNGTATPMVPPVDIADGDLVAATGAALARYLPPTQFLSLELANEPDLHPSPFSTNFSLYTRTLDMWLRALEAVGVNRIVDAPVLAGSSWWPLMEAGFLRAFAPRLRAFSQHRYGLSACSHLHPPTPEALMGVNTSWGSANDTALLAAVGGAGIAFVVGEGNTVSCNGSAGVSDTFGSALYALDASFSALAANASAFRWHGVGDDSQFFFYQPVYYEVGRLREAGYDAAYPRPIFLGLWALAEAAPPGSTLLRTLVNASSSGGGGGGGDPPLLVAWALRHPTPSATSAALAVVILNKESLQSAQASVTPPTPCAPGAFATLTRLLPGPGGLSATTGSTYANLSFDGTHTGVPVGTRVAEKVPCGGGEGGGGFQFTLPPTSAAILVF